MLDSGLKYTPISVKPEESQFIETQQFNVNTIARIYGIPGEMVGGQTAGPLAYSSPEMRATDFLTFTLRPWLTRLEVALGSLLPRGQYVKFSTGALLRTDLKTRYESYKLALEGGWLTLDEVRELEDREPLRRAA